MHQNENQYSRMTDIPEYAEGNHLVHLPLRYIETNRKRQGGQPPGTTPTTAGNKPD